MRKFQKFKFERPSFRNKPKYKSIGYFYSVPQKMRNENEFTDFKKEGCEVVFQDITSSRIKGEERPQLMAALKELSFGDELVVYKIHCLGSTNVEIAKRMHILQKKGIHIKTLDGFINTRDHDQSAVTLLGLLVGFAEIESSLNKERYIESFQHRRERGDSLGGRPKTSYIKEKLALRLRGEGFSYRSIREQTGLALSTIRRIIVEKDSLEA